MYALSPYASITFENEIRFKSNLFGTNACIKGTKEQYEQIRELFQKMHALYNLNESLSKILCMSEEQTCSVVEMLIQIGMIE